MRDSKRFATLLWTARTKAGFRTATSFLSALAERGLVYDESTYARWERGTRIPSSREDLIILVECIIQHGGIIEVDEANELVDIAGYGYLTNDESARLFGQQSLINKQVSDFSQSQLLDSNHSIFNMWDSIRNYLWTQGKWNELERLALQMYQTAVLSNNEQVLTKLCIRDIGWLYYWQGRLALAEKYIKEGRNCAKKGKDDYWLAYADQRFGKIYQAQGKYAESLLSLESSLNKFQQFRELERVGDTLSYIAQTYLLSDKVQKSDIYYREAIKTVDSINDLEQKAIICSDLGVLYIVKNELDNAESYFSSSLELNKRVGGIGGGVLWNNLGLGYIKEKTGKTNQAADMYSIAHKEYSKLSVRFPKSVSLVTLKLEKEFASNTFYNFASHSSKKRFR